MFCPLKGPFNRISARLALVALFALAGLAAGCRELNIADGKLPCSASGSCPSPYRCVQGTCTKAPPGDGGPAEVPEVPEEQRPAADSPDGATPNLADAPPNGEDAVMQLLCPEDQHPCEGKCVPRNDPNTCAGSCTPCSAPLGGTATCDGKGCGGSCAAGKNLCNGACQEAGTVCGPCPAMTHACGGLCPSNQSIHACGTLCTPCPIPSGAVQATCDGTKCDFVCGTGYRNCPNTNSCIASASPACCINADCVGGTNNTVSPCNDNVCSLRVKLAWAKRTAAPNNSVALAACSTAAGSRLYVVDSGGRIWSSPQDTISWTHRGTIAGTTSIACGENNNTDINQQRVFIKAVTAAEQLIFMSERSAADGSWLQWGGNNASGTRRISNDGKGKILSLNSDFNVYVMKRTTDGWDLAGKTPGTTAIAMKRWTDALGTTKTRWFNVIDGDLHVSGISSSTPDAASNKYIRTPLWDLGSNFPRDLILDVSHPAPDNETKLWVLTTTGKLFTLEVSQNQTVPF